MVDVSEARSLDGCGFVGLGDECSEPASFYLVCWTCEAWTPICATHAMVIAAPDVHARCNMCGRFLAPHILPMVDKANGST